METTTRSARAHDALVTQLMTFGRASLNFVADEYRDREARVARRTGLVVGPAQAGGILGLIGLGIAATSTLKSGLQRQQGDVQTRGGSGVGGAAGDPEPQRDRPAGPPTPAPCSITPTSCSA